MTEHGPAIVGDQGGDPVRTESEPAASQTKRHSAPSELIGHPQAEIVDVFRAGCIEKPIHQEMHVHCIDVDMRSRSSPIHTGIGRGSSWPSTPHPTAHPLS